MGLAEFEWKRDEKINGVIYDMLARPNYQHRIINFKSLQAVPIRSIAFLN